MKKSIGPMAAVLCLILLLLNPATAAAGAARGLALWGQTVVPVLLPFMLCTGAVVGFQATDLLVRPAAPLFKRLLGLSKEGSFVMLCGLLCGYPMGAKLDGEFLKDRRISAQEARYLLAICNHPSPMFLLGYTAGQLADAGAPDFGPALLAALYLPVLFLAVRAGKRYRHFEVQLSAAQLDPTVRSEQPSFSFDAHMMSSFETMVRIGGYIMLFSMAAAYLEKLGLPPAISAVLIAFLEITTGIRSLCSTFPSNSCLVLTAAACAFGGLSGIFQTKSVLKNPELSIRDYIQWKCLHSALSALMMAFFVYL